MLTCPVKGLLRPLCRALRWLMDGAGSMRPGKWLQSQSKGAVGESCGREVRRRGKVSRIFRVTRTW